jgi:hypothetical protein
MSKATHTDKFYRVLAGELILDYGEALLNDPWVAVRDLADSGPSYDSSTDTWAEIDGDKLHDEIMKQA